VIADRAIADWISGGMNMRIWMVPAAAALALTACGGETAVDADGDGSISASEARAAIEREGDFKPQPGKYKTTMNLIKMDMPGAPAEMKNMMSGMMDRSFEYCLTKEEAEKGFEDALTEGQDESCDIKDFSIDGSDVSMKMSCDQGGMGTMEVTMDGKVSPTSSDMNMTMQGTIPELGPVEMAMSFQQERIGDCDS
jgi:hypothetical protein